MNEAENIGLALTLRASRNECPLSVTFAIHPASIKNISRVLDVFVDVVVSVRREQETTTAVS
jgi:hypothetical protein